MFKILKKLFQRTDAPVASTAPRVRSTAAPQSVARQPEAAPGVEVASLSLRAILERLPADLKANVNQMPEADVKIILPVNAIMKQLPTGSIKMSLGSLFRQAPNGTFRRANIEDKRMIGVPLSEVFKTINPGRLHRRTDQRRYDVPEDIQGLFGSTATRSVSPAQQAPVSLPDPPAEPVKPLRMPGLSGTPGQPPSATPAAEPKKAGTNGNGHAPAGSPSGASSPSLNLTGELSLLLVEIGAGWPKGVRNELSVLTGDTKVVLPVSEVSAGLQGGKVAFTWAQLKKWLSPAPASPINVPDDHVLVLPLKIVAPAFVAATGAKKRQSTPTVNETLPDFFGPTAGRTPTKPPTNGVEAPTQTPAEPVTNGTTNGAAAAPSNAQALRIESAPLKMEAPAPLESTAAPVDAAPAPVENTPAVAPAAPAPNAETAALPPAARSAAMPQSLAELFNQPGKTDWAPNELVKLTCDLPGVIGAVVALEEGLVVAQRLPDGLSPDTFAAFVPQIFSRLDKYTGEMQLGDTEEVTVSTSGGPCRFFRRGKLFFATLGRSGESLPAGLHLVAAELASQNS